MLISKEQHAEQDEQVVAAMNAFRLQNNDPLDAPWPTLLLSTIVQKLRRSSDGKRLLSPTYAAADACDELLEQERGLSELLQEAWSKKELLKSGVLVSLLFPFSLAVIDFDCRGIAGYVVNR